MKKMNKRLTYLLFTLLCLNVLPGCSDRPSGVLSEKKMVNLMVDMELAEGYLNTQGGNTADKRLEVGRQVMEMHGVSAESLDTTLAWYGRNMDDYSELFAKVDKEILKRQEKFISDAGKINIEPDNLWPYNTHQVLSPLSGHDGFQFVVHEPEIEKGEKLQFSFFLPNPASLKGAIGVEYKDGDGENFVNTFSTSRHNIQLDLQTDTSKKVSKIYGSVFVKDTHSLPLFIDSISLKALPIDSANYRSSRRSLKKYGVMIRQPLPEPKDTVSVKDSTERKSNPKFIDPTHNRKDK